MAFPVVMGIGVEKLPELRMNGAFLQDTTYEVSEAWKY